MSPDAVLPQSQDIHRPFRSHSPVTALSPLVTSSPVSGRHTAQKRPWGTHPETEDPRWRGKTQRSPPRSNENGTPTLGNFELPVPPISQPRVKSCLPPPGGNSPHPTVSRERLVVLQFSRCLLHFFDTQLRTPTYGRSNGHVGL